MDEQRSVDRRSAEERPRAVRLMLGLGAASALMLATIGVLYPPALLLGVLALIATVVVSTVLAARSTARLAPIWCAALAGAALLAAVVVENVFWVQAFDYVDANTVPPVWMTGAQRASEWCIVGALVLLAAVGVSTGIRAGRRTSVLQVAEHQ